jgi:DNA-binding MarR family transcriptional regulator
VNKTEQHLFEALTEINQWEWLSLPSVRSLYFCLANEIMKNVEVRAGQPLKQVLFHPEFTDRAIRMKLREFEKDGLIERLPDDIDKRYRRLVPTQALVDAIHKHAQTLRQTIEKSVYCVDKH